MEHELTEEIRAYIRENMQADVPSFLLRKDHPDGMPIRFVASQIEGRQRAQKKLPDWVQRDDLIFPPSLNLEQSSSTLTATFKASLVAGQKAVDLTGGFGVDAAAFSKTFGQVDYVEQNAELAGIAQHNFERLGLANISAHTQEAVAFLREMPNPADLLYLDPDRRPQQHTRALGLSESAPNVVELAGLLLEKGKRVMLKASPMLDIAHAVKSLPYLQEIYVVAAGQECKEVLLVMGHAHRAKIDLQACLLSDTGDPVIFQGGLEDKSLPIALSLPLAYIFEPHAAILKAGLSHRLATQLGLQKLHLATSLFTAAQPVSGFLGRTFELESILPLKPKLLKKAIPSGKANITVRNFPMTVAQIRQKTGLKEGGDHYLFACTLQDGNRRILVCKKPSN